MSIRRQSIISSILVYIGIGLGLVNTYLYAKGFSESEYGLIGSFQAFATLMLSFSNLGLTYYIFKFYPYYKDNLPREKNDMITIALVVGFMGFLFVMIGGFVFKDLVVRKYSAHSPEVVRYYYWFFPFGFGLSIYTVLEAFAWQLRKSVFTTFVKEILFRLFATILIVLLFFRFIKDFDLFIKIYAFTYIGIAGSLIGYLIYTRQLHFTFTISRVSKKFSKKIISSSLFVWGGFLVVNVSSVFDTLVIGAVVTNGMMYVGIYTLAQNMSGLVFAPQRAISAAAVGPLSQAWKDKDMGRINRIYQRSSINQLIFGVAIFLLIWLNFNDAVLTLHLKQGYLDARIIFLFIGLTKVIDMGTGLNAQIIGTSIYWKVEILSGVILLLLTLPLNYLLTLELHEKGPAVANLFSIIVYNGIRYFFLLKKFKLQPFTLQTIYSLLLAAVCYVICFLLFNSFQGFIWLVLRSSLFILLYATGVLYLKLTPDVLPVWETVKKKLKLTKQ
ncbi:polysaccharide biosynthesis protein [Niastella yeongjuensis]|uniref:Polysaccharide biosynthesis protein n=1 Tax=Niastella yeongjuensis TaxID=354355 RepID=A0A1V9E122_9BACT|nr:oligosaccharide flippase family protein [Niastella yeongjuensis]OQP39779.1 polysaccharide biosynthesis protein [Niastella yeongjuensis]SEO05054.1 Membrane protein involved in the export of O-antigen and teichoic acid [Niastella yeongjuensis]